MPSRCVELPIEWCMLDQQCQWFKRSPKAKEHCGQIASWADESVAQKRSAGLAAFRAELDAFRAKNPEMKYRDAQKAVSKMRKGQVGGGKGCHRVKKGDITINRGHGICEEYNGPDDIVDGCAKVGTTCAEMEDPILRVPIEKLRAWLEIQSVETLKDLAKSTKTALDSYVKSLRVKLLKGEGIELWNNNIDTLRNRLNLIEEIFSMKQQTGGERGVFMDLPIDDEGPMRRVYHDAVKRMNVNRGNIQFLEEDFAKAKSAKEKASIGSKLDIARKEYFIAEKEFDALKKVCKSC
jgi:hypothetical protein